MMDFLIYLMYHVVRAVQSNSLLLLLGEKKTKTFRILVVNCFDFQTNKAKDWKDLEIIQEKLFCRCGICFWYHSLVLFFLYLPMGRGCLTTFFFL